MGALRMNEQANLQVIPSTPDDAEREQACMEAVYDVTYLEDQVFSAEQFRHHTAVFPEGQFIAVEGTGETARVVGLTVSMRFNFDPANPPIEPWWQTINGGWLYHDPDGEWLYGVESCVLPDYQGRGVGGMLMQARFDTARALNLRGMAAGSALVGYGEHAHQVTPEQYVQGVVEGRYFDNNLSKQLRKGFKAGAVIPNYVTDETALGWGAWIVWANPEYDPARQDIPMQMAARQYAVNLKPMRGQQPGVR